MNSAEAALRSDGPEIRAARTHVASRLNWLRAGVLGADDGIVPSQVSSWAWLRRPGSLR
jgi:hypothetical protein